VGDGATEAHWKSLLKAKKVFNTNKEQRLIHEANNSQ
jgi:hypothetical protein